MAEAKNKPNILNRRVNGAVKPKNGFDESLATSKDVQVATASAKTPKKSKANNSKSLKISEETYKDLSVVKNMDNIKFDYEAIQMLIDQYVASLDDSSQRRFTVLRENI